MDTNTNIPEIPLAPLTPRTKGDQQSDDDSTGGGGTGGEGGSTTGGGGDAGTTSSSSDTKQYTLGGTETEEIEQKGVQQTELPQSVRSVVEASRLALSMVTQARVALLAHQDKVETPQSSDIQTVRAEPRAKAGEASVDEERAKLIKQTTELLQETVRELQKLDPERKTPFTQDLITSLNEACTKLEQAGAREAGDIVVVVNVELRGQALAAVETAVAETKGTTEEERKKIAEDAKKELEPKPQPQQQVLTPDEVRERKKEESEKKKEEAKAEESSEAKETTPQAVVIAEAQEEEPAPAPNPSLLERVANRFEEMLGATSSSQPVPNVGLEKFNESLAEGSQDFSSLHALMEAAEHEYQSFMQLRETSQTAATALKQAKDKLATAQKEVAEKPLSFEGREYLNLEQLEQERLGRAKDLDEAKKPGSKSPPEAFNNVNQDYEKALSQRAAVLDPLEAAVKSGQQTSDAAEQALRGASRENYNRLLEAAGIKQDQQDDPEAQNFAAIIAGMVNPRGPVAEVEPITEGEFAARAAGAAYAAAIEALKRGDKEEANKYLSMVKAFAAQAQASGMSPTAIELHARGGRLDFQKQYSEPVKTADRTDSQHRMGLSEARERAADRVLGWTTIDVRPEQARAAAAIQGQARAAMQNLGLGSSNPSLGSKSPPKVFYDKSSSRDFSFNEGGTQREFTLRLQDKQVRKDILALRSGDPKLTITPPSGVPEPQYRAALERMSSGVVVPRRVSYIPPISSNLPAPREMVTLDVKWPGVGQKADLSLEDQIYSTMKVAAQAAIAEKRSGVFFDPAPYLNAATTDLERNAVMEHFGNAVSRVAQDKEVFPRGVQGDFCLVIAADRDTPTVRSDKEKDLCPVLASGNVDPIEFAAANRVAVAVDHSIGDVLSQQLRTRTVDHDPSILGDARKDADYRAAGHKKPLEPRAAKPGKPMTLEQQAIIKELAAGPTKERKEDLMTEFNARLGDGQLPLTNVTNGKTEQHKDQTKFVFGDGQVNMYFNRNGQFEDLTVSPEAKDCAVNFGGVTMEVQEQGLITFWRENENVFSTKARRQQNAEETSPQPLQAPEGSLEHIRDLYNRGATAPATQSAHRPGGTAVGL